MGGETPCPTQRGLGNRMHRPLEFVSLFSGAGGLDLGFELAGWQCLYASDIDRDACATLEANRASLINRRRVMREAVIRHLS